MAEDYSSTSARWRAIVNRDAAASGFVYGVRTTKIYCRPRCPARLARRANVEFYDTPRLAEKAGYRPCKRCKPEDLRAPPDPHIRLAQRACETMTLAALAGGDKQRPTLSDLSGEAGLTPSHFHRVFKKVVGVTPGKFGRELMERKSLGKVMVPAGLNAKIAWPPAHLAPLLGLPPSSSSSAALSPKQQPSSSSSAAALSPKQQQQQPQVQTPALGDGDDRSVEPHPINWNEFDLMLAAASEPRQQLSYPEPPTTTLSAMCMPFDSGLNPMLPFDQTMAGLNFAQYMAEPVDFSFMHLPAALVPPGYAVHSPADSFAHPTPSPTSVPSLYSHPSLSPTDSPVLFDASFAGLATAGSPLLLDESDWLDSQVLLQPDFSLDHCVRS